MPYLKRLAVSLSYLKPTSVIVAAPKFDYVCPFSYVAFKTGSLILIRATLDDSWGLRRVPQLKSLADILSWIKDFVSDNGGRT